MEEHSTWSRRLSPTIEEVQRIVRQPTEEQRKFLGAFDPTVEHAYRIPELGKRMGVTKEDARRAYNAIGHIIQKELEASFDFDYMYQHGRTSWPNLLFDAVKSDRWYFSLSPELQAVTVKSDRWYFSLSPELQVVLVEEGILPPNKPRKAK
jgi:hypothetical protein